MILEMCHYARLELKQGAVAVENSVVTGRVLLWPHLALILVQLTLRMNIRTLARALLLQKWSVGANRTSISLVLNPSFPASSPNK